MIKAYPMVSERSGRAVANQYIIHTDESIIFQSYESTIAVLDKLTGRLTLGVDFDYSRTTVKYLHQFITRYVDYQLNRKIDAMPGSCYTRKINAAIDRGLIHYDGGLR